MTTRGLMVGFLLASSQVQTHCRSLLLTEPNWCGQVVLGDSETPLSEPSCDTLLSQSGGWPDVVLLDRQSYENHGQNLRHVLALNQPAIVWLLADEDLAPLPDLGHWVIQDYLFQSQLQGNRLEFTIRNLWHHRQLQQQLNNYRHLEALLGQAGVGINQTDATGQYTRVNQRFCDGLGYTEGELLQLTEWEVTHPDDLEHQAELEHQLLAGESAATTLEKRYLTKDGHIVWARVTLSVIQAGGNHSLHRLAIVEDVGDRLQLETQHQQVEADLRRQRNLLLTFLNNLPHIAWLKDWEGRFIATNAAFGESCGFAPADLVGKTDYDIWPVELAQAYRDDDFAVIAAGQQHRVEEPLATADGSRRWIDTIKTPFFGESGEVLGTVGIAIDVTDRKQAEADLVQSEARLVEAQELAHLGHWEYDLHSGKILWSQELLRQYGFDKTIPGPTFEQFAAGVHPEDWPTVAQAIQTLMTEGTPYALQHRIIRPDGTVRFTLCKGQASFDEQGQVVKLFGVSQDVTETQETAQALQASQTRYRYLVENLPNGAVHTLDRDLQITFMGGQSLQTVNLNPADCIGHPASAFLSAEAWARVEPLLLQTLAGQPAQWEMPFAGYQFLFSTTPLYDPEGAIEGVLCISQDITNLKQAELAWRESEERLRFALDAAHMGNWDWDIVHDRIVWSKGLEQMMGLAPGSFDGSLATVTAMIHPDDRQQVIHAISQSLEQGADYDVEFRFVKPDGSVRWAAGKGNVLRNAAGEAVRMVGVDMDITARKQTELDLQHTTAELDRFFSTALDLLCIANTDGYFLRLNPAWETTLGYSQEELKAKPFLEFVHGDDVEHTLATLSQLSEHREVLNFVNRYRHQDGSYRWIEWRSFPLGNLIYAAARDITDRKAAETRLERQNVLLAQIARGASLDVILQALVQEVEQQLPDALCSLLLLDDQKRMYHGAIHKLPQAYVELIEGLEIGDGVGSCGTAAWRQETVIVTDIAQDPLWRDYKDMARRFDLHACWSFPIISSSGKVLGVFGTYYQTVRSPRAEELQTLEQIANLAGIALERQQAEVALKTSEARFRQLAETVREGFFVINLQSPQVCLEQHPYAYINPAYAAITGFPSAAIAADRNLWFSHIHPDDQPRIAAALERQMQGEVFDTEYRYLRPDGEVRWLRSQGFPLADDQGVITRIVGTVEDITARKQAEAALQESERRYATLTEMSPNAIFRFDAEGNCLYVNPRWCEMTGCTAAQGYGDDWIQVLHPDDRDHLLADLQDTILQKKYLRNEGRHLLPDGSVNWFDGQLVPELDDNGELLGFVGTLVDITQRKQAELALQASEARFKQLAEASPGIIFTLVLAVDGTLHFEYLSPAFEALHEISIEAAYQDAAVVFQQMHPDDRPGYEQAARESAAALCPFQYECRFNTPSGVKWLQMSSRPTRQPGGTTVFYGVVLETTHRKQAEAALQESSRKLQQTQHIAQLGGWEFDLQTGEGFWTAETYAIHELSPEDCLPPSLETADHYLNFYPPEAQSQLQAAIQTAMNTGAAYDLELPFVTAKGNHRWVRACGQPVFEAGVMVRVSGIIMDITDRKQAELALYQLNQELEERVQQRAQELARSERDLRTIFNNVYDAIFIHDLDGRILDVNDRALEMSGATRDQLIGAGIADLSGPDAPLARTVEYLRQAQTEDILCLEWQNRRFDDNAPFDTEVTIRQVNLGDRPVLLAGVRDITDRKAAERALQASERRYATLAEVAPVAIFRFDDPLNCTYVSDRWSVLTGRPTASALGHGWMESLHPEDRDHLLALWSACYKQAKPGELLFEGNEGRHLRPDGSINWFYVQVAPELNIKGEVIGYIGTLTDITERKHIEAQLVESEAKFRRLVEGASDLIWAVDHHSQFTYLSPQFTILFGWQPSEWMGRPCTELIHPADRAFVKDDFQNPVCLGQVSRRIEFRHRHQQGHYVWVRSSGAPIYDAAGTFVGIQGILSDISDRKQVEQALREVNTELENRVADRTAELVEARDAAENANQAKSIFLANMSHELRTPLNAILGFSQLMGRNTDLSPQHLEGLKIINRSGDHLLTLINDILEMSKIEAGQATLNPEDFNLPQLLSNLVDMLRLKAVSKGLSLTLTSHPHLPQDICTDSRKLRQVLLNLLSNAIKFTQMGYVALRVAPTHLADRSLMKLKPADSIADEAALVGLRFEVEDSGVGIAQEELRLLFEPFVQTTSGRLSQEGTGLGLPISYQFVQLLGGELTVTSQPGAGSTFAFDIPVRVVDGAAIARRETPQRVLAIAPGQPAYRILVVEDNWANRFFLQSLLTEIGFRVETAVNGQTAVDSWQTWQPHLIFMDIRMPVMNGCEATREIRRREQFWREQQGTMPATKIISLTAGVFEDDQANFNQIGFDGLIRKPFQENDITRIIARHLPVAYLYDPEVSPPEAVVAPAVIHLHVEMLQRLAPDWLAQFHTALMQLDQPQMRVLINRLPPEQAVVAQALHHKVNDFDYELLIDLVQTVLAT